MMKIAKYVVSTVAASAMLAGCAVAPAGPGAKQGDIPPRLIVRDNVKTWDRPEAFGPVPADLAKTGQVVCATLDTKDVQHMATGYHKLAQDVDGKILPAGGYYCARK